MGDGIIPGSSLKLALSANHGLRQPLVRVEIIVHEMPPNAQGRTVDGFFVVPGIDFHDPVLCRSHGKGAAHPAESAD